MSNDEWNEFKNNSPVRIQWDPERDLFLQPLEHRAIQIGLSNEAVELYVNEWIQKITEVTPLAHDIRSLVQEGKLNDARARLPAEQILYLHMS